MRALSMLLFASALAPHGVLAQETNDAPVPAESAEAAGVAPAPPVQAPPAAAPAPSAPAPAMAAPQPFAPRVAPSAPAPSAPLVPPAPAYSYPYPQPYYDYSAPPTWGPYYGSHGNGTSHYVLPPLPAGYVYIPAPAASAPATATGGAGRELAYDELTRVDARMADLQRKPIRLGGPITFMVLGYATLAVAGLTGLGAFASAERIQHDDYDLEADQSDLDVNDDGKINGHDARRFRRAARIAGVVAGTGLLLGIFGTRSLVKRREERRRRAQELRGLAQRRAVLRAELGISPELAPGRYGIAWQSRF